MIPEDADPDIIELFKNHPKVKEDPELLDCYVTKFYGDRIKKYPIPEQLTKMKRWAIFEKVWNEEKKKFDKFPRTPRGGKPLPGFPNKDYDSDLEYYDKVKMVCDSNAAFVPSFYVYKEDGLIFLDYDAPCEKPHFRTYTERSMNGGYHVIGWYTGVKPVIPGCDEVYINGRWVVITGDIVDAKCYVNDITEFIRGISQSKCQPVKEERPAGAKKIDGAPFKAPEVIKEGGRNRTLFNSGCSLRAKGFMEAEIYATLCVMNKTRCLPQLSEEEVKSIVVSVSKYKPGVSS